MKYLCLVHLEHGVFDVLSEEKRDEIGRRSLAYDEELKSAGHLIHADALQSPASAVLVKLRNGEMSAASGPSTEATKQLVGFIGAADLRIPRAIGGHARMAAEDRQGRMRLTQTRRSV